MVRPFRFSLVLGTRPEAIKLAPLVRELRARRHRVQIIATGQHPDLAAAMLAEVGLEADVDLAVHRPGNSPADTLAAALARLTPLLAATRPDMLFVQGDTTSTLAGALAASYARLPIGHVEAGLRTRDRANPFPEETHRCLVSVLADLHFAPTPSARDALLGEGIAASRIAITGNSGIDALLATAEALGQTPDAARARFPMLEDRSRPWLVATVHRRENLGEGLNRIARALRQLVRETGAGLMMPLHPNPAARTCLRHALEGLPHVCLTEPVGHADMVWLMLNASLLLTDSGGLQEEAPALGLRTLILRERTERPEAVACGAARLVGTDPAVIVAEALAALAAPRLPPLYPFGDGQAAARIADRAEAFLAHPLPAPPRPVLQPA